MMSCNIPLQRNSSTKLVIIISFCGKDRKSPLKKFLLLRDELPLALLL
jgi:hypothetical protein